MTGSKELFQEMREGEMDLINMVRQYPVSKREITIKADHAVSTIVDSGMSLEIAEAISAMDKFIEAVRKDPRFLEAVREKTGKSITLKSGTQIQSCETGVKYDYSLDAEWRELEKLVQPLRKKQQEREEFLKTIPAGKQLIDEDGVITATGPSRTSTSSFKVTLVK